MRTAQALGNTNMRAVTKKSQVVDLILNKLFLKIHIN